MKPLRRYRTTFWGQSCTSRPFLVDRVFGDGKEIITFQYMDDRPDYYVVRVGTGTAALMDRKEDEFYDLLGRIENQIADEGMDFYSERAWREHDRKGYVYTNRRWPVPPYQPCGSSWGTYDGKLEFPRRRKKRR